MDNIVKRNIAKGTKLMESALRMYSNGNSKIAYETVNEAQKYLKEAYKAENSADGKDIMKYGDNLNFGALYKVFESNSASMFKDASRHGSLKAIVEAINGNKVLKDEFNAYNAFTNPTDVTDAREYVSEACSLIRKHSARELYENNLKLLNLMRRNGISEDVKITDDEAELFESVEYMITNRKGFGNISKVSDTQNILTEHVGRNNRVSDNGETIDERFDKEVRAITEKYDGMLSDDEIELIKEVQDPVKSEKRFNELKEEITKSIDEKRRSGVDSAEWGAILEKVNGKMFDKGTALQDIAEFIEIQGVLDEE